MKKIIIVVALAFMASTTTACSSLTALANGNLILDVKKIEDGIKDSLTDQGIETAKVDCPDSMSGVTGDSWLCVATDPWDFSSNVRVTLTSSDGFVEWEIEY